LADDTGERYFSEYLQWMKQVKPKYTAQDLCLCDICGVPKPNEATLPVAEETTVMLLASPTVLPSPTEKETEPARDLNTAVPQNEANSITVASIRQQMTFIMPAPTPPQQQQQQEDPAIPPSPFQQFPFYQPPFFYPPWFTMMPVANPHCCASHREWLNRPGRRGRPPHDYHCRKRRPIPGITDTVDNR
jgi:hypothetical protein